MTGLKKRMNEWMNNLDTFMRVGFVEEKGEGGGRHKDNSREL